MLVAAVTEANVLEAGGEWHGLVNSGCGVTTAVHACRLAGVAPGEWVAVYGVNGVGFGLVQLLKQKGFRKS